MESFKARTLVLTQAGWSKLAKPQTTCDCIEQSPSLAMWFGVQSGIRKLDWRDGEGKRERKNPAL